MPRDYEERHEQQDGRAGQRARHVGRDPGPRKVAFAVTERDGKSFWTKIGSAFDNQDGSITVLLDALPLSGKLQIRTENRRDDRGRDD